METFVVDANGIRYELGRLIGKGGQGSVFAVKHCRLAVKIVNQPSARKAEMLRNRLTRVRLMPLKEISITRPLEMLREPHLGYVMDLLEDVKPLQELEKPAEGVQDTARWYLDTGGLRRRLRILAETARIFAVLHSKGIIYSDPSLQNVCFSASAVDDDVWLLDADNLCYSTSPAQEATYTPGFGAPELLQKRSGANTLTDSHAFAVVAFMTLTGTHPLIGDMVEEGPPELEEKAFYGDMPWIEHPEDTGNASSRGVPRELVLSPLMRKLFHRTFSAGMKNPLERPGIAEWREVLFRAAQSTLKCPECGATYFVNNRSCPWCDRERPSYVVVRIGLLNLTDAEETHIRKKNNEFHDVAAAIVDESESFFIDDALGFGKPIAFEKNRFVEISLHGKKLQIRKIGDVNATLETPGASFIELGETGKTLNMKENATNGFLHIGDMSRMHRIIHFELREGN